MNLINQISEFYQSVLENKKIIKPEKINIFLYGSRAKNQNRDNSDIDILVLQEGLKEIIEHFGYIKIENVIVPVELRAMTLDQALSRIEKSTIFSHSMLQNISLTESSDLSEFLKERASVSLQSKKEKIAAQIFSMNKETLLYQYRFAQTDVKNILENLIFKQNNVEFNTKISELILDYYYYVQILRILFKIDSTDSDPRLLEIILLLSERRPSRLLNCGKFFIPEWFLVTLDELNKIDDKDKYQKVSKIFSILNAGFEKIFKIPLLIQFSNTNPNKTEALYYI